MLSRWAMRFGGALLFVVINASVAEPVRAGGRISGLCRSLLGIYRRTAMALPAKPSPAEIQHHNRLLARKNLYILDAMGAKPAENYADVDVYPDPDGFKRNLLWEELLEETKRQSLPRYILTLPKSARLAVNSRTSLYAQWTTFAKGATISLWQSGSIEYFQPVDDRDIRLFRISDY